jgi:hypothetical protein
MRSHILVKDVLSSFSWWNGKGVRSFDPKSSGDEIERASAYSRQVAEALSWLNDPEVFKSEGHVDHTFSISAVEMSKQVEALAQQLGWFRNEGKNIGQGALD